MREKKHQFTHVTNTYLAKIKTEILLSLQELPRTWQQGAFGKACSRLDCMPCEFNLRAEKFLPDSQLEFTPTRKDFALFVLITNYIMIKCVQGRYRHRYTVVPSALCSSTNKAVPCFLFQRVQRKGFSILAWLGNRFVLRHPNQRNFRFDKVDRVLRYFWVTFFQKGQITRIGLFNTSAVK